MQLIRKSNNLKFTTLVTLISDMGLSKLKYDIQTQSFLGYCQKAKLTSHKRIRRRKMASKWQWKETICSSL